MPAEVTAGDMADMVGTLLEDMPPPAMLKADTPVSVLAVDALILRGPRADRGAMQLAHIIGMAVVTGEAVTGEAVTGIRPILGSAITIWATAIHTTGLAITAIVTVDTIRTTEIGDTILTSTDSGPQ